MTIDLEADIPTDLLADPTWDMVKEDLKLGVFDSVGIATPCGTFSPLRESPPGPRPLRSLERPMGLPREQLSESEQKQLSQSNRLLEISATAFLLTVDACKGVWWENPDHGNKLDMWKTPFAETALQRPQVELSKFDQCRFGAETTKPTTFATCMLDLSCLNETRCNHEKKEYRKSDGSSYMAAHESLVQRWRSTDRGRERASKRLGEYPPLLNQRLSEAMAAVETHRANTLRSLKSEPIP